MSKQQTGIVVLGGKEYQTVALRVQKFREMYAEWSIVTCIIERTETYVLFRAEVRDAQGRVIATGHAEETRSNKGVNSTSAIENCETSAIGRCLATMGFAGSGEFASANEIETKVEPKQNPLDIAREWGLKHATEIAQFNLTDKWTTALQGAKLETLRDIVAIVNGVPK